jgi:hypothetical protein
MLADFLLCKMWLLQEYEDSTDIRRPRRVAVPTIDL